LKNPVVPSASSLSEKLDNLRLMEDAGAAAVVCYSLFEEEIIHDSLELNDRLNQGTESFFEATSYFPEPDTFFVGPDGYLEHIRKAKQALGIPVIGSLNGSSEGGWVRYAKLIQDAGADALELNIYFLPTDLFATAGKTEQLYRHSESGEKPGHDPRGRQDEPVLQCVRRNGQAAGGGWSKRIGAFQPFLPAGY
jgi:dihydroorotate dehydrogenase (fumarate)